MIQNSKQISFPMFFLGLLAFRCTETPQPRRPYQIYFLQTADNLDQDLYKI